MEYEVGRVCGTRGREINAFRFKVRKHEGERTLE
jgi:predicted RNA-binding protein YlqC (UPF0109 family)